MAQTASAVAPKNRMFISMGFGPAQGVRGCEDTGEKGSGKLCFDGIAFSPFYELLGLVFLISSFMIRSIFTLLTVSFLFASCTSINSTMREPNAHVQFESGDFEMSNQVSASAKTSTILGIDLARLFKTESGSVEGDNIASALGSLPVVGGFVSDPTQGYALYELYQNNPGYDVVFYPQFVTTATCPVLGICFIQKNTTVDVKARMGKIK